MFGRQAPTADGAGANSSAASSSDSRFSLVELRRIHQQLVENKNVNEENKNLVVEILRIIAEMVVYGDNKSELLFDFFCEKNMLSLFLEIMWTEGGCPSAIHIQILQTLSILINCVRNDTSLYYLLSNNYINEIIIFPHDFGSDESLRDQFASFMKSVSLKLNAQTVQFFFIEETGAFPILTKAIELMGIPEPMVRISSQTTILNIYRVEDARSREYALQDEVMHKMFVQVTNLMISQFTTIVNTCHFYFKASNNLDEAGAMKFEQTLEDILTNTEDWFYYLQDMLDLNILVLRQALVNHIMNEFVYAQLLQPLLNPEQKSQSRAGVESPMKALEISGANDRSVPERISFSDNEEEFETTMKLIASLVYILQMVRIITDPLLKRAIFTALYHPLHHNSRKVLIEKLCSKKAVSLSDVNLEPNSFRGALLDLIRRDNQKLAIISVYLFHLLCDRLIVESPANERYESELFSAQELVRMFQTMRVLPPAATAEVIKPAEVNLLAVSMADVSITDEKPAPQKDAKGEVAAVVEAPPLDVSVDTSKDGSAPSSPSADMPRESEATSRRMTNRQRYNNRYLDKLPKRKQTYDAHADFISMDLLAKIEGLCGGMQQRGAGGGGGTVIESYLNILMYPTNYSLTALQVVAHSVYMLCCLIHKAYFLKSGDPGSSARKDPTGEALLQWMLGEIRKTIRSSSKILLERVNGPLSEIVLNLIKEEMKRFEGRKWRQIVPKMYSDILLFLPSTAANLQRMGIDFDIPISQVETVRKDIQAFLMTRALFMQVHRLYKVSSDMTKDELCASIKDIEFLAIDEVNMIPTSISEATSFDMRGRRFLDAVSFPPPNVGLSELEGSSSSGSGQSNIWSTSASILSLGYLGNRKANSSSPNAGASSSPNPRSSKRISTTPTGSVSAPGSKSVLFIQDPTLLLLISQDKGASNKIVFRVFVASPLLYTDAKIDPEDRKKFKILVRSWKPVKHMYKTEPDITLLQDDKEDTAGIAGDKWRKSTKSPVFLLPCERSNFWQLNLSMETEQACMLVLQHIENKRQEIFNSKMSRLKTMLNNWASESEHVSEELTMSF